VQVSIRSQRVADHLNAQIRGVAEAAGSGPFDDVLALAETAKRESKSPGYSHAGREYQKHMSRGELPKVPGKEFDRAGQDLLDSILKSANTHQFPLDAGHFKGGRIFVRPDGLGAAFDKDGVFQYFGKFSYEGK
jgi:hypothetical protein